MKKFTLFLSAMLFSVMSFAGVVTFTPADFEGQGTSGSGSPVTVTKDGVTVSCDKGYGNKYALRCYKDGVVTISATENIASLEFAFDTYDDRYYNGNLEESYTVGETSWSTTLASQARFTSIVVTLGEGGETPDTPDTPDTPVTGTEITGVQGADATYVADEEFGDYWIFDLYASIDEAEGMYMSPYLYVETYEAYGKTTLNGTYNIYYAEYWKNENEEDVVNTDEVAEEPVGTLTIKNKDNNGNYSFVGSFVGLDGKTYTLNQVVPVTAYEYLGQDEDGYDIYEDLTLSENGSTPDTPEGMITCTEAASIAVTEGYKGTENVTVYGYVVELGNQKVDDKTGRNKQCFYMSDTEGGEKQFMAFWAFVPDYFKVGDKVAVTGILQNYKGTIEIADGEATLLSTTSIEEVFVSENPIKVINNGQVLIIRGENVYNVLGAQVK
ncbi:MAG: hypothetical protein IJ000_02330 [Paludibacteraceae bacterium]|nr:hypothetical protein [Paludibacteraceae bacterium]